MPLLPLLLASWTSAPDPRMRTSRLWELRQRLGVNAQIAAKATGTAARLDWVRRTFPRVYPEVVRAVREAGFDPDSQIYQRVDPLLPWVAKTLQDQMEGPIQDRQAVPDLIPILDWYEGGEVNLDRVSFVDAARRAHAWHEAHFGGGNEGVWADWTTRVESALRRRAAMIPGEVLYTWPDGFTLQRLRTSAMMRQEGEIMGHCVGTHGYAKRVEQGQTQILSLRNTQGFPVITMEANTPQQRGGIVELGQVKGPRNSAPPALFRPYLTRVRQLLNDEAVRAWRARAQAVAPPSVDLDGVHLVRAFADGVRIFEVPPLYAQVKPYLDVFGFSDQANIRYKSYWVDLEGSGLSAYKKAWVVFDASGLASAVALFYASRIEGSFELTTVVGALGGMPPDDVRASLATAVLEAFYPPPAKPPRPNTGYVSPGNDPFTYVNPALSEMKNSILLWIHRGDEGFAPCVLSDPRRALVYATVVDQQAEPDTAMAVLGTGTPPSAAWLAALDKDKAFCAEGWASYLDKAWTPATLSRVVLDDKTALSYFRRFPACIEASTEAREYLFTHPAVLFDLLGGPLLRIHRHYRGGPWVSHWTFSETDPLLALPLWREPAVRARLCAAPDTALMVAAAIDRGPSEEALRGVIQSPERSLQWLMIFPSRLEEVDPRLTEAVARSPNWQRMWQSLGFHLKMAAPRKKDAAWSIQRERETQVEKDTRRVWPLLLEAYRAASSAERERLNAAQQILVGMAKQAAPSAEAVARWGRGETFHPSQGQFPWAGRKAALETIRALDPSFLPLDLETPWFPRVQDVPVPSVYAPVVSATKDRVEVAVFPFYGQTRPRRNETDGRNSVLVFPACSDPRSPLWAGADPVRRGTRGAAGVQELWTWWTALPRPAQTQVLKRMRQDAAAMQQQDVGAETTATGREMWARAFPDFAPWPDGCPGWARGAVDAPSGPEDLANRCAVVWVGVTPLDALRHGRVQHGLVLDLGQLPLYGIFPWRAALGNAGYILVMPAGCGQISTENVKGTASVEAPS